MVDNTEKLPLDARLLSDTIIELNISRRNVAIYPADHPSVDKSLSRAFNFLQKLFELRPQITLAVAKDTLIVDNQYLDKKNPVYREFALTLNKMNVAYITFTTGITKEELYTFHSFISRNTANVTAGTIQAAFRENKFVHIDIGFVDYEAFSFEEGKTAQETQEKHLWERYVYGLIEGTLQTEEIPDAVRQIPPEILAQLLNRDSHKDLKEEAYDKVITTYIRRSSETAFTGQDLRRILDFINHLKPELKTQFLSSTIKTLSKDTDAVYTALKEISADEVIMLLNVMTEQKIVIPQALKNLLDKLSNLSESDSEFMHFEDGVLVDDILLSPEISTLFKKGNFDAFITTTYQKEIQKLLNYSALETDTPQLREFEYEFNDELIEQNFTLILLEMMSSEIVSEEEYHSFMDVVKEQSKQLIWVGKYDLILKALGVFQSNREKGRFPEIHTAAFQYYESPEFISELIASFSIAGRQKRQDVLMICEYFKDQHIIPLLIDALIQEKSQGIRRFLLEILKKLGDKVIPEAIKKLTNENWFVKRNMLYILGETNSQEIIPIVKPYCRDENVKVSFEAIKCLLNAKDSYAIKILKEFLHSKSRDRVELAITLAGAFRIKAVVSDLLHILNKRGLTGEDFYEKIPVVKALGDIGDPHAVDTLRRLLSGKSLLFKSMAEQLKEEIYRSLKNYPYEEVQDLVSAGLKSSNKSIREESLRIHKLSAG